MNRRFQIFVMITGLMLTACGKDEQVNQQGAPQNPQVAQPAQPQGNPYGQDPYGEDDGGYGYGGGGGFFPGFSFSYQSMNNGCDPYGNCNYNNVGVGVGWPGAYGYGMGGAYPGPYGAGAPGYGMGMGGAGYPGWY